MASSPSVVPAVPDVRALHAEAVEVSRAAEQFEHDNAHKDLEAHAARATAARERLEADILAELESRVIPAAAGGHRDAVVYEFKGGAAYDDFSVVFLLLGGDDRQRREELRAFGFEPMIVTLRRRLRPFGLRHVWDKETNGNVLVVTW